MQRQPTTERRGTLPGRIRSWSRAWGWILRLAVLALLVAATMLAIVPSCGTSDAASAELGAGGTYGAEISLSIIGRGRVTSSPNAIDCPSNCFSGIVLASASADGGDGGVTLIAQETTGAHFIGWSFAEVDLGARGRGPSQCSPLMRKASVPPQIERSTVITVPFGETQGTPPRGHEEECAPFTTVSLAYAVTATFAPDPPVEGFDAAPTDEADLDVLFLPPTTGTQAKEIGVTGGYAYWRFEKDGLFSGVAGSYLASNTSQEIIPPTRIIRAFHVGRHAVFQYADDDSLWVIQGGTLDGASPLGGAPPCLSLASDALNVYCRAALDGGSAIYAWPVSGADAAAPSIVHVLPAGSALAVDTQRFYFSEDHDVLPNQSKIFSTTRDADVDGAVSGFSLVALGQTAPIGMSVGPTFLAWVDVLTGNQAARSASKILNGAPSTGLTMNAIRYVAADPLSNVYWIGVGDDGNGSWAIYKALALSATTATTFVRSGLTDLGGLAVDTTYLYWTRPNGRVYRAFKNDGSGGFP